VGGDGKKGTRENPQVAIVTAHEKDDVKDGLKRKKKGPTPALERRELHTQARKSRKL